MYIEGRVSASVVNALANNARHLRRLTFSDVPCHEYLAVAQALASAFNQHKMPALQQLLLTITDRKMGDEKHFERLDEVNWALPQRMRYLKLSTDGRRSLGWFVHNWPQIHAPHLQRLSLKPQPNANGMLRVIQTVGRVCLGY